MKAIPIRTTDVFSLKELRVLKAFYAGQLARTIRREFQCDPWVLVKKHRHLEETLYERIAKIVSLDSVQISLEDLQPEPAISEQIAPKRIETPRAKRCPYCGGIFGGAHWKNVHNGSAMIGFTDSGCIPCFKKLLAKYNESRKKR